MEILKKHYKKIVFFLVNILIVAGGVSAIKNASQGNSTEAVSVGNNTSTKTTSNNTNGAVQSSGRNNVMRTSARTRTS